MYNTKVSVIDGFRSYKDQSFGSKIFYKLDNEILTAYRFVFWRRNSFPLVFKGRLIEDDGAYILEGEYTAAKWSKILWYIWFVVCFVITLVAFLEDGKGNLNVIGISIGIALFGILVIRLGWLFAWMDMKKNRRIFFSNIS